MNHLWTHYVIPSLRNNGASMVLGALFLPLVKKYLKAESKRPGLVLRHLWSKLRRGRVTVQGEEPK